MRVGVLQPGDKTELFAMTTQDMSPGANAPAVKVSSKELQFPVVQHPQNAPLRPTAQEAGWIAFGAFYLALILAGLGVKVFSLMGVRFALVTPEKATPPFTAAPPVAVVPAAPLTATAQAAWQRPKVS